MPPRRLFAEWAKRFSDEYSPTRYNNAVDTVRSIFEVAIDHGLIYRNPATKLKKRRPNTKHLGSPASEQFGAIVQSVRGEGVWCSKQCGDLLGGPGVLRLQIGRGQERKMGGRRESRHLGEWRH